MLSELGDELKTETDARRSTNVAANDRDYRTSVDRLYAAGDVRAAASHWSSGQSVRGARQARAIDEGF